MPIGSRFTHTVAILRASESGAEDDYNHPITTEAVLETVKAAIQPKDQREQALVSQGGAAVSDHTIYMFPTDVTTADAIEHDADDCPLTADLPTMRFEILGVPNAAGLGHHLEIEARAVAAPAEAEGS